MNFNHVMAFHRVAAAGSFTLAARMTIRLTCRACTLS